MPSSVNFVPSALTNPFGVFTCGDASDVSARSSSESETSEPNEKCILS